MATLDERIEKIRIRKDQLAERERRLKAQRSKAERKARTRRLIKIGASVEAAYGHAIEEDDIPKLIKFLKQQEERGHFLSKALSAEKTESGITESKAHEKHFREVSTSDSEEDE